MSDFETSQGYSAQSLGETENWVSDDHVLSFLHEWSSTNAAWRLMGVHVEDAGDGWVLARMPFQSGLLQSVGSVHGGFLAMLMDSASGAAVWPRLKEDEVVVTVDLNIHYIRPVRNSDILAKARVKHSGLTTALTECTLYDATTHKQVAFGTALFMILKKRTRG